MAKRKERLMEKINERLRLITKMNQRLKTNQRLLARLMAKRKRKEQVKDQIGAAYFRVRVLDGKKGRRIQWYKFDLPSEEEEDWGYYDNKESPTQLLPFSETTDQPETCVSIGLNSKLYCLGCYSSSTRKRPREVYWYDTMQPWKNWQRAPKMRFSRASPDVVAVDGKIIVMGGLYFDCINNYDDDDSYNKYWAEVYDPNPNASCCGWAPVEVTTNDGENLRNPKPLMSMLKNSKYEISSNFLLGKLSPHEIFICFRSGFSFVYDVSDKSLTTVVTNKLYHNLWHKTSPPLFIERTVYSFDWDHGRFEAYNLLGGNMSKEKTSGPIITESQKQKSMTPITFRTDGLSSANQNRLHLLSKSIRTKKPQSHLIFNFTTLTLENDKFNSPPKSKYFSIPSSGVDTDVMTIDAILL